MRERKGERVDLNMSFILDIFKSTESNIHSEIISQVSSVHFPGILSMRFCSDRYVVSHLFNFPVVINNPVFTRQV